MFTFALAVAGYGSCIEFFFCLLINILPFRLVVLARLVRLVLIIRFLTEHEKMKKATRLKVRGALLFDLPRPITLFNLKDLRK